MGREDDPRTRLNLLSPAYALREVQISFVMGSLGTETTERAFYEAQLRVEQSHDEIYCCDGERRSAATRLFWCWFGGRAERVIKNVPGTRACLGQREAAGLGHHVRPVSSRAASKITKAGMTRSNAISKNGVKCVEKRQKSRLSPR